MSDRPPGYIAVEGPIGVGKTTLTHRLADRFGYQTLLEPAEENPFLERFYRDGAAHALPTQLYFLLHRTEQLRALRARDLFDRGTVADFVIEKDRLFAELTLDAEELRLYESVYAHLTVESITPDLIIYLQAPAQVLLQRIRQRGVAAEQAIEPAYLERLSEAYARFFHFYEGAPVLIVNAAQVDFANDDASLDELIARVVSPLGARQYFNPNPTLI